MVDVRRSPTCDVLVEYMKDRYIVPNTCTFFWQFARCWKSIRIVKDRYICYQTVEGFSTVRCWKFIRIVKDRYICYQTLEGFSTVLVENSLGPVYILYTLTKATLARSTNQRKTILLFLLVNQTDSKKEFFFFVMLLKSKNIIPIMSHFIEKNSLTLLSYFFLLKIKS